MPSAKGWPQCGIRLKGAFPISLVCVFLLTTATDNCLSVIPCLAASSPPRTPGGGERPPSATQRVEAPSPRSWGGPLRGRRGRASGTAGALETVPRRNTVTGVPEDTQVPQPLEAFSVSQLLRRGSILLLYAALLAHQSCRWGCPIFRSDEVSPRCYRDLPATRACTKNSAVAVACLTMAAQHFRTARTLQRWSKKSVRKDADVSSPAKATVPRRRSDGSETRSKRKGDPRWPLRRTRMALLKSPFSSKARAQAGSGGDSAPGLLVAENDGPWSIVLGSAAMAIDAACASFEQKAYADEASLTGGVGVPAATKNPADDTGSRRATEGLQAADASAKARARARRSRLFLHLGKVVGGEETTVASGGTSPSSDDGKTGSDSARPVHVRLRKPRPMSRVPKLKAAQRISRESRVLQEKFRKRLTTFFEFSESLTLAGGGDGGSPSPEEETGSPVEARAVVREALWIYRASTLGTAERLWVETKNAHVGETIDRAMEAITQVEDPVPEAGMALLQELGSLSQEAPVVPDLEAMLLRAAELLDRSHPGKIGDDFLSAAIFTDSYEAVFRSVCAETLRAPFAEVASGFVCRVAGQVQRSFDALTENLLLKTPSRSEAARAAVQAFYKLQALTIISKTLDLKDAAWVALGESHDRLLRAAHSGGGHELTAPMVDYCRHARADEDLLRLIERRIAKLKEAMASEMRQAYGEAVAKHMSERAVSPASPTEPRRSSAVLLQLQEQNWELLNDAFFLHFRDALHESAEEGVRPAVAMLPNLPVSRCYRVFGLLHDPSVLKNMFSYYIGQIDQRAPQLYLDMLQKTAIRLCKEVSWLKPALEAEWTTMFEREWDSFRRKVQVLVSLAELMNMESHPLVREIGGVLKALYRGKREPRWFDYIIRQLNPQNVALKVKLYPAEDARGILSHSVTGGKSFRECLGEPLQGAPVDYTWGDSD